VTYSFQTKMEREVK